MKDEETTYKIIDACVPRGTTEKLAQSTSRTTESVNVWRRRRMTGVPNRNKFNPLDLVELIQDHAFAHAPHEVHRIHQYLKRRYDSFFASVFNTKATPLTVEERDGDLAAISKEYAETIQAILLKAPPDRIRKEWEDLHRRIEEMVSRIELGVEKPPVKNVIDLPKIATGGGGK